MSGNSQSGTNGGIIAASIGAKIEQAFDKISYFKLENESHAHAGPSLESHFKLILVSDEFSGKALLSRHQRLYQLLAHEMNSGVHALALHLFTEAEWALNPGNLASPKCRSGE